jgi:hypothetical protein
MITTNYDHSLRDPVTGEKLYQVTESHLRELWQGQVDTVLDSLVYHQLFIDVHTDGGASLNPMSLEHAAISDRYIASFKGGTIIPAENGFGVNYWTFVRQLKEVACRAVIAAKQHKYDGRTYVGLWLDRRTGSLYLDISRSFKRRCDALRFAERNNQLSIYDSKTDDVIWLQEGDYNE